jgi:hypothetical protein
VGHVADADDDGGGVLRGCHDHIMPGPGMRRSRAAPTDHHADVAEC